MQDYEKQANEFLNKTGATLGIVFSHHGKHFDSDTETRDIYTCLLKRGRRSYTFNFGQSIANSKKFIDKINGNEFTPSGANLKGRLKVIKLSYLTEFCKEVKGTPPTAYDVLTCLQKYDVGSFADFCGEFGYDEDSRSAKKTYKAVRKEFSKVSELFSDEEIEELQEIQ